MYLVSVIAAETYCILNCDYCMYTKKTKKNFDDQEISSLNINIDKINEFIKTSAPTTKVVSLTWWEPALFPNIIKQFYEKFSDRLIRICTNWILTDKIWFDDFSPEKIYFAISLDWITLEDNRFRLKSEWLLNKILSNIDMLLKKWFSVELLSVLGPQNITTYFNMLKYFEENYGEYITNGQLRFIPFELVNYMNQDKFNLESRQIEEFINTIKNNKSSLVISLYKEYFEKIISFYSWQSVKSCWMYKWWVYLKYLWDSLWKSGSLNVYWCWSRGHLMMGTMNFSSKYDYKFIMERRNTKSVEEYFKCEACSKCFDNRHFYWMMLDGEMTYIPPILKKTLSLSI